MTKDFYFNTAEAMDKAKADRDKPVTPVDYIPVISEVGSDSNMVFPDTMYGLLPKGTGKITLHESKPAPMTKDEALDKALEALEICEQHGYIPVRLTRDAITAIKQARSAPVQEPVALVIDGVLVKSSLPEKYTGPLYTTPPAAQRQWVGLTDEEIYKIDCLLITDITELVIAIEAKLKERNV